MTQTQTPQKNNLANLFVFSNPEGEDQQSFLEEVGTLVFQSALMKFIFVSDDAQVELFENFINENVSSDSFIEILCAQYPEFETILVSEMNAFQAEAILI